MRETSSIKDNAPCKQNGYGEASEITLARSEAVLDPIIIVLASAAGALIGTATGILMFRRKMRPPITDAELGALKGKVETAEASLASATANLEDLRKQISAQEKTLLQNGEDLKKKQQQIEAETAETQKEKTRRAAAEQTVQELGAKVVVLTEQSAKMEGQVKEAQGLAASKATRLEAVDAELEAGKRKIQELTDQTAQLTAESAELKRLGEQEVRLRTLLEAQLNTEQERIVQMTGRIAELQTERERLEIKVQDESRSAAKGMELLLMAQEKLASAFRALSVDGQTIQNIQNGQNGNHGQPDAGEKTNASDVARAAASSK